MYTVDKSSTRLPSFDEVMNTAAAAAAAAAADDDDDDDDDELFLRTVDQRKTFCFISSRDYSQKFSPSQIACRKQDFNLRGT